MVKEERSQGQNPEMVRRYVRSVGKKVSSRNSATSGLRKTSTSYSLKNKESQL